MPDLFDMPPANAEDTLALADYARQAYLEYALSVVKGRALPDDLLDLFQGEVAP